MNKKEYLRPEAEQFILPTAMRLLASLSLDTSIDDFEGGEIDGF